MVQYEIISAENLHDRWYADQLKIIEKLHKDYENKKYFSTKSRLLAIERLVHKSQEIRLSECPIICEICHGLLINSLPEDNWKTSNSRLGGTMHLKCIED